MYELTFTQAVEGFLLAKRAEGISTNTLDQYAWAYRKLSAFLSTDPPLATLTTDEIRNFLASLGHLSRKSRNSIQVALSSLWTWACTEGYAATHVLQPIPLLRAHPPDIAPFGQAELRKLLTACDHSEPYTSWRHPSSTRNARPTALRDRALILFLVDTGLRASELCNLLVSDVNTDSQSVDVRGKGDKPRIVHYAKSCSLALWRYHATRQPHLQADQPLFHVGPVDAPAPFERRVLGRLLHRIGDRAGVTPANPHRFRHTFAIQFLRNGGNLFALQDLLGHSNLEMVRRYARIVQADRARAHKLASPADKWRL